MSPLQQLTAPAVLAHGFGIRYDLPVPLYLYVVAAASVVVLSFLLVVFFVRAREGETGYPRLPLDSLPLIGPLVRGPIPRLVGGTIGVLVLAAIIVTGLLGATDATSNPAEYLLWIYFWAATVILSGLVGNIYALVNPWSAIFDVITRIPGLRRLRAGLVTYPRRLGMWPAVAGYFGFAFFELASGYAAQPRAVAWAAVAYTSCTLVMMAVFGRDTWLTKGEFFSVLFRLVGAFSPVEVTEAGGHRRVYLRPIAVGLTNLELEGWDMAAFVLLTLSSLAFDGFSATPVWANFYLGLGDIMDSLGPKLGPALVKGGGLLGLTLVFFAVYMLFMTAVNRFGRGRVSLMRAATLFAFTLVPIALVYNAAHNYSYMVIQGQGLYPLLADPLHNGAHLFPVPSHFVASFALADAAFVWGLQVVLIVVGHVIAVYLAHRRALITYPDGRGAIRSQFPMLVLMVLYTSVSLWILSQPITEAG
ncbi:MAG: hypothetical protein WAT58_13220 [Candidatus Dormiibacterota bacterium]